MQERDLFWLAGLLEGEGWFGLHRQVIKGKEYLNPCISVKMVDADIIYYVKKLIGNGSIGTTILPSGKTAFIWRTSGIAAVTLMKSLYLQMGTRRQGQMNLVFEAWRIKNEKRSSSNIENQKRELEILLDVSQSSGTDRDILLPN